MHCIDHSSLPAGAGSDHPSDGQRGPPAQTDHGAGPADALSAWAASRAATGTGAAAPQQALPAASTGAQPGGTGGAAPESTAGAQPSGAHFSTPFAGDGGCKGDVLATTCGACACDCVPMSFLHMALNQVVPCCHIEVGLGAASEQIRSSQRSLRMHNFVLVIRRCVHVLLLSGRECCWPALAVRTQPAAGQVAGHLHWMIDCVDAASLHEIF